MKKFSLSIFGALALSLACTSVFAADGTITVNGAVTDQTCTLQSRGNGTGLKDLTINLPAIPKSTFTPTNPAPGLYYNISLYLKDATGTEECDAATMKAFQGIHLSAISPADLDVTDKTLLVNKAIGASTTNPVFAQMHNYGFSDVDFSAPWGIQARSEIFKDNEIYTDYYVSLISKSGIVDAQNFTAIINYTLHYN